MRSRSIWASALGSRFSSASRTARIVPSMLSPVSPSGTGITLSALISCWRSARCRWATSTTRRNRSIDGSAIGCEVIALGVLRDLVGLQATGADVNAAGTSRVGDADLLQIRLEAPARRHHRVAARIAERGALAAAETHLGH